VNASFSRRNSLLDRVPEVLERVSRSAGKALAASEVVEQQGILRMGFDQNA
jgi:hypothetical protein